jgi:hypothetical protein
MGYVNGYPAASTADIWSQRRLVHQGESFDVVDVHRVTGTGHRFDGRVSVTLARVSDGKRFSYLGTRAMRRLPHNARLTEKNSQ